MKTVSVKLASLMVALSIVGCGHDGADESHAQDSAGSSGLSTPMAAAAAHDDDHGVAETDQSSEVMRQAAAHLHGDAKLAIALDESALVIELDTPLYNLTGFEHEPQTSTEATVLQNVQIILSLPAGLFSFNPEANCLPRVNNQAVELTPPSKDSGDGEAGHADHHAEEAQHDAHSEEHDEATHRDVLIEYAFDCESPEQLQSITVELFDLFPRMEELDTVFLDQTTQRSVRLDPNNHRINLSR